MAKRKLTPFRRKYLAFQTAETRRKVKLQCIEYKGGKCEKCGYDKCPDALSFHHVDPSKKEFGLAAEGISRKFENCKNELDKCILLCMNCHAEHHYAENMLIREEKLKFIVDEKRKINPTSVWDSIDLLEMRKTKTLRAIAEELDVHINTVILQIKKKKQNY